MAKSRLVRFYQAVSAFSYHTPVKSEALNWIRNVINGRRSLSNTLWRQWIPKCSTARWSSTVFGFNIPICAVSSSASMWSAKRRIYLLSHSVLSMKTLWTGSSETHQIPTIAMRRHKWSLTFPENHHLMINLMKARSVRMSLQRWNQGFPLVKQRISLLTPEKLFRALMELQVFSNDAHTYGMGLSKRVLVMCPLLINCRYRRAVFNNGAVIWKDKGRSNLSRVVLFDNCARIGGLKHTEAFRSSAKASNDGVTRS